MGGALVILATVLVCIAVLPIAQRVRVATYHWTLRRFGMEDDE
jgi:hypothetical protein